MRAQFFQKAEKPRKKWEFLWAVKHLWHMKIYEELYINYINVLVPCTKKLKRFNLVDTLLKNVVFVVNFHQPKFTVIFSLDILRSKLKVFLIANHFCQMFWQLQTVSDTFVFFVFFKNWVYFVVKLPLFFFASTKFKHWNFSAEFSPVNIIVIHWILLTQIHFTVTFSIETLNIKLKIFLIVNHICDMLAQLWIVVEHFCWLPSNTFIQSLH